MMVMVKKLFWDWPIVLAILIFIFEPVEARGRAADTESVAENRPALPLIKGTGAERQALTLDQCIEIALENSPVLGYRASEVQEVNAARRQRASQRWPSFRAVGSFDHYSDTQRVAIPRGPNYPLIYADDILSWNLVMTVPLFTGGRISKEIEAAALSQRSAEHSYDYARQELIFRITSVYFSILKQRKIIESLDFSRSTMETHLKRARELIALKKAAGLDELRIEVRLANIIQKIEHENSILSIHIRSLANLMGFKETDFNIRPQNELPFEEVEIELDRNLGIALLNRSDYQSALKDVEAQAKRIQAARAAYWPSVSFYAAYGARQAVGSFIHPPGIDGIERIGHAGLFFEFPLFEGGKTKATVALEEAKLASLKERLREMELAIRLDVETAVLNLDSTGKRISAIEKAIEQASESLKIELKKYDLGKGLITDTLDAESALLEIQTVYYVARADYNIYRAQLKFVQGQLP